MNEIKWTLFSEQEPTIPRLYITDFKSVWITSHPKDYTYVNDARELAWAEIPIPEVPVKKKEFHRCESNNLLASSLHSSNCSPFVCWIKLFNLSLLEAL